MKRLLRIFLVLSCVIVLLATISPTEAAGGGWVITSVTCNVNNGVISVIGDWSGSGFPYAYAIIGGGWADHYNLVGLSIQKKLNLANNLYYRKLIIFKNQLVPRTTP